MRHAPDDGSHALDHAVARIARFAGAAWADLHVHAERADQPSEIIRWTRQESSASHVGRRRRARRHSCRDPAARRRDARGHAAAARRAGRRRREHRVTRAARGGGGRPGGGVGACARGERARRIEGADSPHRARRHGESARRGGLARASPAAVGDAPERGDGRTAPRPGAARRARSSRGVPRHRERQRASRRSHRAHPHAASPGYGGERTGFAQRRLSQCREAPEGVPPRRRRWRSTSCSRTVCRASTAMPYSSSRW